MYAWMIRNQEKLIKIVAASVWATPAFAFGAINSITTPPTGVTKTGFDTIDNSIAKIFNIVITVAGVAFVVLFLLGGIQYLGAAGNDEGTKKARQLMLDAVVGLAIVVVAWAVGTYVLTLIGLDTAGAGNLNTTPVK